MGARRILWWWALLLLVHLFPPAASDPSRNRTSACGNLHVTRQPPTVRFAPTNVTGFLQTLNVTFDVWTAPGAVDDYAEGYVLYVLRHWTAVVGVSMATGKVAFAHFQTLERNPRPGKPWARLIPVCRHLNATALVCAREGDWGGNASLLFYDVVSGTAWRRALRHPRLTVLHHDLRVNPRTNSVLLLSQAFVNITHNNVTCTIEDLTTVTEVSLNGTVRWEMDLHPILWPLFVKNILRTKEYKCRDPCKCRNNNKPGDFFHANTIHWDLTEDAVYMSFRHIGTLVKIHRANRTVEWLAGHLTGLRYLDIQGNVSQYGFLSLHEPTKFGPNRFLLFDNRRDVWGFAVPKLRRPLMHKNGACIREILVFPNTSTVREVFSWCFPKPCHAMGYVQPLPDGHYLGHHPYACLTTIRDKNGTERWQAKASQRGTQSYRAQVFYLRPPVVAVLRSCSLHLTIHDCFYRTYSVRGTVTLRPLRSRRSTVLSWFTLPPYWKAATVVVAVPAEEGTDRSFLIDVHVEGAAEPTTFCVSPNNPLHCGP